MAKAKSRSVKFAPSAEPDLFTPTDMAYQITSKLCRIVQETAEEKVARLQLLVKNRKLLRYSNARACYESEAHSFVSLDTLIRKNWSERVENRQTYLLALLLTHGFMQMGGESLSTVILAMGQIFFWENTSAGNFDISKPYFSTKWEHKQLIHSTGTDSISPESYQIEDVHRIHPHPNILALGILLLQLGLGTSIEVYRDKNSPNNRVDRPYRVEADLPAAEKMLKKIEGNCLPPYTAAIKACLSPGTFARGLCLDDDILQAQLYHNVVRLIERAVKAYGMDPDGESNNSTQDLVEWQGERPHFRQEIFRTPIDDTQKLPLRPFLPPPTDLHPSNGLVK